MKKTFIALGVLFAPAAAFAQNSSGDLLGVVRLAGTIVNMLVPLVSTLVIVFFFWGLAKYVLSAGDADAAKEGKSIMIWGVLALFVMVTIWGIISFLQKTIGNDDPVIQQNIVIPTVTPSSVQGVNVGGGY